ncbi:MAG: MoaD/ThiS family protein [Burkholderiales bacterium]|nr:MoaD/ThiS family protein [Burkholderiales bacterium]
MKAGAAARVAVNLPTPLTIYTDGRRDVTASGSTLDELLHDLDHQFPGMRFRMIDELGRGRAHMKFFLNGAQQRDLAANIREGDRLMIVAAISGG